MADLISREAAIAEIDEYFHGLDSCISEPDLKLDGYKNGLQVAIQEVKALPAVDAVPVVHGRWIDENPDDSLDPRMRCSICTGVESPLVRWRYCPNCGAKMDKERRDRE